MNRNTLILTASLALTLVAGPVLAAPKCTTEAKDKWLSEEVMKQKISEMGFKDNSGSTSLSIRAHPSRFTITVCQSFCTISRQ